MNFVLILRFFLHMIFNNFYGLIKCSYYNTWFITNKLLSINKITYFISQFRNNNFIFLIFIKYNYFLFINFYYNLILLFYFYPFHSYIIILIY